MRTTVGLRNAVAAVACIVAALAAGGGAYGRGVYGTTRTSVNRGANVNTNVNANRNANVNVNRNANVHRDIDVDVDHGYYHPVARATTAAAVTAVAIGTMVNTLPPSC